MFHVNPDTGDVGRCRALNGRCPFGGKADHFMTAETARAAYEHFMQFAEGDERFNRREVELDYTPEQAVEKFNAEIKGKEFSLDVNYGDEPGRLLEELYGKNPINSDPGADLGHTELKTVHKRGKKHITLGMISSGSNLYTLRSKYSQDGMIAVTPLPHKWVDFGDFKFKLDFNDKKRQMSILVSDKNGNLIEKKGNIAWDYSVIEDKVDIKLQNIAIAVYERKLADKSAKGKFADTVIFTDMKLAGYTKKSMLDKLKSGDVNVEVLVSKRNRRVTLNTNLEKVFPES